MDCDFAVILLFLLYNPTIALYNFGLEALGINYWLVHQIHKNIVRFPFHFVLGGNLTAKNCSSSL